MEHVSEKQSGEYTISSDVSMLDVEEIHRYLSEESYWSKNIPLSVVNASIENSFCIGAYYKGEQIGFARIITDYATFGYLADVYILEGHRGKGLSKKLMKFILKLDWVKSLRRFMLATVDAHGLYRQFGFKEFLHPSRMMEINQPGIYGDKNSPCK
jgi:GNAT superfamily N-acetyltransferase